MKSSDRRFVIIAAAGLGTRMKSNVPKQFLLIKGIPVIVHTILSFSHVWNQAEFIVALSEEEFTRWKKIRSKHLNKLPITITKGGATRFHSVKNALKLIKTDGLVAVQDACRPFVSQQLLNKCEKTAREKGNAVPAVELKDSICEILKESIRTRQRQRYRMVQTPQCFDATLLKDSYKQTFKEEFTDDASVVEAAGNRIYLVEGEHTNFKITTPLDLKFAENILAARP